MKIKYTRVYADSNGESHFEDVEVDLATTDFAPPAPPLNVSDSIPASKFLFLRGQAGWHEDWHPAPKRQFTIYLDGEIEGQVSDGEVRRFGPGSVVLAEDTFGKGHISRVVGSKDVLLAVVQLED